MPCPAGCWLAGKAGRDADLVKQASSSAHECDHCYYSWSALGSCSPSAVPVPPRCTDTQVETRYREYKRGKDLVIVEGATVDGIGNLLELNGRFAAELDAPVLMVSHWRGGEGGGVGVQRVAAWSTGLLVRLVGWSLNVCHVLPSVGRPHLLAACTELVCLSGL